MEYAPCISQIATLLADPKRSAMMWALLDGSARSADELALLAGLSLSSASAHLARLSAGGLLRLEARGRKRFFRLSAPEIATAVEALANASLASAPLAVNHSIKLQTPDTAALKRARQCHDHLGGELACELYQRLLAAGWIEQHDQRIRVTSVGAQRFAERGLFIQALAHGRHETVCVCHDVRERRPHLGGVLGAGLLQLFLQSGWLGVMEDSRALRISPNGERQIDKFAALVELELAG
ncbi:helix-turn-helix domain-containing protein [Pseudomonas asplenii]|uniref:Transcriptional regulator, ArsR family n=1 Tax=Pseudomonas asplenii TaxID=53407 RepID=A0A1H6PDT0_9PSED|nr:MULTISPECIES: helix-turn-helix transcriptional regulator [Pseudomonas]UZE29781.1 ArsR family transcriptional regulator [Pseudomonas asplenii]SEI25000.1 transcriptional regulator, ArsR family [Pseudomonas fuscovaginae]